LTVSNIISGAASSNALTLTKDGSGALVLGGTNTYTGITTINTGVIQATNGSALGSTSGITVVESGAALEVNGAITIPEEISINGTGLAATPGAIRMMNASNAIISGPINILSDSRINNTAAGTLTFQTGAFTNTNGVTFGITSTGGITVTSIISGAGSLTKDGSGTGKLVLSGANTYQGATLVTAGILQATVNDALGSQTAGTLGYSSTTVSSGAALEINGTISSIPENIFINGTGIVVAER